MRIRFLINSLFIFLVSFNLKGQSTNSDFHSGQLFVKMKEEFPRAISIESPKDIQQFFQAYQSEFGITHVKSTFWFSKTASNRIVRVYFNPNTNVDLFIKNLESSGKVEYAERIPISKHHFTPNDLGSNSTIAGGQWYMYKIHAPEAWDVQTASNTVVVAVVDDAIQVTHSELQGVALTGYDVADFDFDVSPPDATWDHGTHIAGLIAAKTNNGNGMASLAYGVKILPIKITTNTDPNTIVSEYEGVSYAIEHGANVINMSWGSHVSSQTGLAIMTDAYNAGITLVASAGNEGTSVINYPAGFPHVISVASTNNIDVRSTFSSYGGWVDISAPGSQIWSLAPNDGTAIKNGTSFAAPLVAATAALLKSANPLLSQDEIENCIISSADNIEIFNPNYFNQLGSGRLNVIEALNCLNANAADINAWLDKVVSPATSICETNTTPVIRVVNSGLDTIQSMTIAWKLDNGFTNYYTWNGEIQHGFSENIILPNINVAPGQHVLQVNILNAINTNQHDAFMQNNVLVYSFHVLGNTGVQLPFSENFESGSFNTNNWVVEDQGGFATWEIAATLGTSPGNKSARIPYFTDFSTGNRDYLVSQTLNFTGYSAISMTFKYAYQQRIPGITDSLIVSISSDCGNTWNRLWQRGENDAYSFATTPYTGSYFSPQFSDDWCGNLVTNTTCGTINLTAFAGMTGVRIRFEGYSRAGNNIYIDNINITGTSSNQAPVADFNANGNLQSCQNSTVVFTNNSLNNPTTYSWLFENGTPATSNQFSPQVSWDTVGTFDVRLIASNATGSDTLLLNDYIQILPNPVISIQSSQDSICVGLQIQLEAQGGSLYLWNASTGLASTDSSIVHVIPSGNTTYVVFGASSNGCISSAQKTITTLSPPSPPVITLNNLTLVSPTAQSYIWYINGLEIENSNSATWDPILNGNYNVRIYDQYGCTAISSIYNVNWVGIHEINQKQIIYSPNPANKSVFIQSESLVKDFQIFSVSGQIILNKSIQAYSTSINTEEIPSGFYFIRFRTLDGDQTRRLVIAH